MARKRICLTCGRAYEYCPSCGGDKMRPRWMINWDTEACKEVFNIVSAYNMGVMTADEAADSLRDRGVKDFSAYKESIASNLKEIVRAASKKNSKAPAEE